MGIKKKALRETYRMLIEAVYAKWNSEKFDDVPRLMEKYKDQEAEIYDRIVRKYVFCRPRKDWQPLIEAMYTRFNPSKLQELDGIFAKYKDSEAALYRALCDKYLPTLAKDDEPLLFKVWDADGSDAISIKDTEEVVRLVSPSQDHQLGQSTQGPSAIDPTGWENLSNVELLQSIAQRERQIVRTAIGGPGTDTALRVPDVEALETRCGHLSQRLEAAERDLRSEREAGRSNRLRVEQLELKLKDREQLLGHAKEMWMKENVRASKLADTLTAVEDKLADQERRLAEVSARYAEAQQEVRQLQHLLGTGLGGVAPTEGFEVDPRGDARNGYPKAWKMDDSVATSTGRDSHLHSPPQTMASTGAQMTFSEGDTNSERFRRLCLMNDAVLYEDELLQIGVKAEYSGLEGQIAVFYGNKGHAALQTFMAQYFVREENALKVVASPLNQHLEADEQIVQRLQVTLLEPFSEYPWLRLQFLLPDASPRRIQLKFPIILPKFMVGRDLSQQDFFRYWRQQHFVLNEVTSVVHLAERLRGPLVNIARCIVFGGAFRLHHGIDSNADNFVMVSMLAGVNPRGHDSAPQSADPDGGLSLMRVEVGSGRFTGKARVVVRSSNHVVAKALCDCLVMQLAELGAFVPQSNSVSAR